MKRIGILGGSSQMATIDYYRRINDGVTAALGGWNTAEILISSMNFQKSVDAVEADSWDTIGEYLAGRAGVLEAGGADLLLCATNTLHRVADRFTRDLTIPFLHIVDPTAAAIRAAGLNRVALLGTRTVMQADFLKDRYDGHGVTIMVPGPADQDLVHQLIFDELCRDIFTAPTKATFLRIVDELEAAGAQGVILGCTEIPLLIAQADRPAMPMFDTVGLHVEAALEIVLAGQCVSTAGV